MSDKNLNTAVPQASRTRGWTAIGGAVAFAAITIASPFVGLFAAGFLAVPVALEGKNNILRRAWNEVKPSLMLVRSDILAVFGIKELNVKRSLKKDVAETDVPAESQVSRLGDQSLSQGFNSAPVIEDTAPVKLPENAPKR